LMLRYCASGSIVWYWLRDAMEKENNDAFYSRDVRCLLEWTMNHLFF